MPICIKCLEQFIGKHNCRFSENKSSSENDAKFDRSSGFSFFRTFTLNFGRYKNMNLYDLFKSTPDEVLGYLNWFVSLRDARLSTIDLIKCWLCELKIDLIDESHTYFKRVSRLIDRIDENINHGQYERPAGDPLYIDV